METTLHNPDLNTLEQLREEKEALKRRLAERSLKNEPSSTSSHLVYADDLKLLHELQVHQLEIEMQDAELRSSHLIQEEFDIKHNDLFEFAPYGYFMLNLEGEIQKINLIGTTLLGIKRSALINESFEKFILNDNKEKFQNCWLNLIETKTRQVCEVKIFQPNGQQLFLRIALSITKYQNTFQILAATTDITMEKQIEDTQSFLLGNSWSKASHDFFEELAEFLYKTLGVDYVCIDKLFKDGLEAETVAVYFDGKFEDSVRYTLEDTPCGKVSGQQVCCFPGKVRELFPKDEVLQEMVAESYAGITLWSTEDKAIGLIAVIGRKPLVDIKLTELVLKQVSIRAASELEHRQAEEVLKESEERYRASFESNLDAILITYLNGGVEAANAEACRMFGMTEQEIINGGRNAVVDLSDPRLKVALEERERTGRFRGELNFKRKDGTIFPVDESNVVYKDKNGIQKTIMVIRDITERKLAEDALKNSEERLKTLYKSMNEGFVNHTVVYENEIAVDYIIDDINPAFEKLTGFDRNTSIGKSASELYGTETPPYLDIYARVAETGISDYFETYFPPMEKHFGISVFSPGKGTFATIFTDITLRKKNEEKLQELNKTFLTLSKSSHAMANSVEEIKYLNQVCSIVLEDCGFKMVWVGFAENDEAKTLRPIASAGFDDDYPNTIPLSWGDNEFGQGPTGTAIRTGEISSCRNMLTDPAFELWREEAVKRGYASFIVFPLITDKHAFGAITIYSSEPDPFNEDQIEMLSKLANDMAHGIATIRLREAHRKTEIALWKSLENLEKLVKLRTRELEITNEHLNNEIKIRVEQEQHLVLTEEKYRTVADFTYNMETWIDTNGNYIYVSPSCERVTGYNASDFFNDSKLLVHIAHPDDRERVKEHFEEKIKGTLPSGDIDFRIITREGKERWIGHSCQSVFNAEGKCLGQRGSNRNINKQKRAEIVLLESENHLRELAHRMDSIAEDERIRVAREIHDEIGHLLTALKYDTEGLINHSEFSPERVKEELTGMISLIEVLIDSVRKIATELRPGILDHMGLLAALEWKIKQFRLKNKICSEYKIDEMDVEFTKNETTFIYRILQEIFTNAMRYSKATHMWISITKKNDFFSMKVRDNGVGFDVASTLQKGSLGLMGMRERAISIGGEIQIESTPGNGTTTTFLLRK